METVEVLIRIPKEDFDFIKDEFADGDMPDEKDLKETTYYAIANGIVLLKGHGRLCDLDAALKCMEEVADDKSKIKECAMGFFDWACSKRVIFEADKEVENGNS